MRRPRRKLFSFSPFSLTFSLGLLAAGCASHRAALPPPIVVVQPDTSRFRKPEGPAFPSASLDSLLTSPTVDGARVSALVVSLADRKRLYSRNAGQGLTPASVQKLLTSAAALYWLSPQFKFSTEVRWDGRDLYVVGGGDPSLTEEDLRDLARDVRRKELGRIRNLLLDGSYLDTLRFGEGWSPEDTLYPYHPMLSAFVCEHDFVTLTVSPKARGKYARVEVEPRTRAVQARSKVEVVDEGRVSIRISQKATRYGVTFDLSGHIASGNKDEAFTRNVADPAWLAGNLFREALLAEGIRMRGKVREGTSPAEAKTIAVHRSQALADLLRTMNKESDNLYAEQVLKTLGAERAGPPGSADKGLLAVRGFLDTLGVRQDSYRIVDGSGLAHANTLSAETLVEVLAWIYKQFRLSPEFVSTLPVAGEDGTLARRLGQASRLTRAKTGTLTGVSSLAGYAVDKRGEVLAFAILVNGFPGPVSEIRDIQDEVVKKLNVW